VVEIIAPIAADHIHERDVVAPVLYPKLERQDS
jgi:hypothetical protein